MKAAIYLRVSTDGQTEENQEPDCLRLCAARGWEPVVIRETESGAKERPEWRRVVELARRGQVGAVVFWALDRIGRKSLQILGFSLSAMSMALIAAIPDSEGDRREDLRRAVVGILDDLGVEHPLAREARRKLASALY